MKVLLFLLLIFISFVGISQSTDTLTLTFISDTQSPLAVEKMFLKNDKQNEKATQLMLNHIAGQPSQNIFILGDVVGLGCKKKYWKTIDNFLLQCKQKNKSVNALLGNHDVMINAKKRIANFEERFISLYSLFILLVLFFTQSLYVISNFTSFVPLVPTSVQPAFL